MPHILKRIKKYLSILCKREEGAPFPFFVISTLVGEMTMKIIRKTIVKQIITEKSREKMKASYENKMNQYKKELEQLEFEKNKLLFQKRFDRSKVEQRFLEEEKKREQQIAWYEFQLTSLDQIPDGSEIYDSEVEEIVEVTVGADWETVAGDRTIIVKDGKVVEIK